MNDSTQPKGTGPLNRRQFLQTTSAAVVGGGILLSAGRAAHAAGSDTLKLALVGCGGRGSGAASQALSTEGSVKLVAMGDAFRDRLDSSYENLKTAHKDRVDVPEDNKFVGFDAYKQAIAQADVVILATPPGFRNIHFEEAVRQGKHVFAEKPVATDAPGVRRFLAAVAESKKKNLKVGIGLQRHHQVPYLETLKRLHDGQIGDIVAMRCYWNDGGVWVKERQANQTEMEYQMRNWYYFTWLGGDHIVEQHIHNLDVINWVKQGHPVRAHGLGGRQVRTGKQFGQIFDHHAVEFEYADGSRCYSQCQHIGGCWSSVSEHVVGTKGRCDVSGASITGENPWKFGEKHTKDPYQQEHDDFFDAIRNDKPYNEGENGAHSTMTAILGRMATYSGKPIEWDDAIKSKIDLMPEQYSWDAMPKVLPNEQGFYPVAIPGKTITV
jgi:predicted dehydrogenase